MTSTGFAEIAQASFFHLPRDPVAELLGGQRVLKHELEDRIDAHRLIEAGLPGEALAALERRLTVLDAEALEKAVGMSLRTIQRRRADPSQSLNPEQGGKLWKFAELLVKATEVMGGQKHAEHWLIEPAIGLNGYRPIDLLSTTVGTEIVETFLGRIEYGVYA